MVHDDRGSRLLGPQLVLVAVSGSPPPFIETLTPEGSGPVQLTPVQVDMRCSRRSLRL
jgi:hypothetical protein